jgi:general secretion pathway protein E
MPPETVLQNNDLLQSFVDHVQIEYCRRHRVCMQRLGDETQLIVTDNAPDYAIDSVRRIVRSPLTKNVVDDVTLDNAINQLFEENRASRGQDLLQDQSSMPIIELVNGIFFDAIRVQASDIHFQPNEHSLTVRMRMDGVLFNVREVPKEVQDEVLTRIKVAGRMDIAEKRLPQDGRATVHVGNRVIDLRIASMPSSHGERIVVRLLDKSARLYRLAELGMDTLSLQRFRSAISVEHGLILVTGPTGSGKSTTLYSALQELDTTERNAVTLEDPIEYQLDGISQTQINLKKGMTFASGLRSVLRQDPDIIMVGEIRDSETAMMAVQAALTGHLVFSTLHTNDAASAVTRMIDLGIEPYLLASSLVGVLAQRLVRRVCPDCRGTESDQRGGAIEILAKGCDKCRNTGYRGRLGIYELMIVDESMRGLITRRSHSTVLRDEAVAKPLEKKSNALLCEQRCRRGMAKQLFPQGRDLSLPRFAFQNRFGLRTILRKFIVWNGNAYRSKLGTRFFRCHSDRF